MASANGRRGAALAALLRSHPHRFELGQAVRLLELMAPETRPAGAASEPRREAVRLRGSLQSSFPPSEIESLKWVEDGAAEVTAAGLGLAGAYGPLPPPLSERIVERERVKDHAARDFLDVFNHRLLSLMVRGQRLFSPAWQVRRDDDLVSSDTPASLPLLALLGIATLEPSAVKARLGGVAKSLVGAAGLINPRPLSAHALERLIGAHFGLPVRVRQFRGGWLTLDAQQYTKLGKSGALGGTTVLGRRIWEQSRGIAIALGPIAYATLIEFLPGGAKHHELAGLAEFALGGSVEVELHLMLPPPEVPAGALGHPRPRLGWTSWLGQAARREPAMTRLRLDSGGPRRADG